jgi:hypothetical protein
MAAAAPGESDNAALLRSLGIEDDDIPEDCDLPPAVIAEFKEVRQ